MNIPVRFIDTERSKYSGGMMTEAKIQTKKIRDVLYCPVCGDNIYKHLESDTQPCAHVLYVYIDEIAEFIYSHKKVQQTLSKIMEDIEADDQSMMTLFELFSSIEETQDHEKMFSSLKEAQAHPVSILTKKISIPSALHISIETNGMACGPVNSTIWIGYDFDED